MLLFLARIFVSHDSITYKVSSHTDGFVVFGSVALTQQNGCMGAYRVIDSKQFPVLISKDKAPTPPTTFGILFFPVFLLFPLLSLSFLSFFLSFFLSLALSDSWRFSPF